MNGPVADAALLALFRERLSVTRFPSVRLDGTAAGFQPRPQWCSQRELTGLLPADAAPAAPPGTVDYRMRGRSRRRCRSTRPR